MTYLCVCRGGVCERDLCPRRVSRKHVMSECKIVKYECLRRVSSKSVVQECHVRVSQKSVK